MFTMIGAAVDIPRKIYKHLSNLGPKLFFFRIAGSNDTYDEYIKILKEDNFDVKKQELQEKISEYLKWFDQCYPIEQDVEQNYDNPLKIPFDDKKDTGL